MTLKVVPISTVHADDDTRIVTKQCEGLVDLGFRVTLVISIENAHLGSLRVRPLKRTSSRFGRMTVKAFQALQVALCERADIYHLHDPELVLIRERGRQAALEQYSWSRELQKLTAFSRGLTG